MKLCEVSSFVDGMGGGDRRSPKIVGGLATFYMLAVLQTRNSRLYGLSSALLVWMFPKETSMSSNALLLLSTTSTSC